jgi:protein tyrosine/serine phosphatase
MEVHNGTLRLGRLFRGGYPVTVGDREWNRKYEHCVKEVGINCIINMASDRADVRRISKNAEWYKILVKQRKVIALNTQFEFDFYKRREFIKFQRKLRKGFLFMIKHKGPYLIHCSAGRDRTGFVIMVLEALMGATLDEITEDYIRTYGRKAERYTNSPLFYATKAYVFNRLELGMGEHYLIDEIIKDKLQKSVEDYLKYYLKLGENNVRILKGRLS